MSRLIAWFLRRPESVLRWFGGAPIVVRDQTLDADAQLVARVMAFAAPTTLAEKSWIRSMFTTLRSLFTVMR